MHERRPPHHVCCPASGTTSLRTTLTRISSCCARWAPARRLARRWAPPRAGSLGRCRCRRGWAQAHAPSQLLRSLAPDCSPAPAPLQGFTSLERLWHRPTLEVVGMGCECGPRCTADPPASCSRACMPVLLLPQAGGAAGRSLPRCSGCPRAVRRAGGQACHPAVPPLRCPTPPRSWVPGGGS